MSANHDDKTSGISGQSMRFAIDHPDYGWKRFPLTRALAVGRGEVCLPEFANQVMRTALVHVQLSNRKAVGVSRIELSKWKFDADGRVDQKEELRRILDRINGGDSGSPVTASATDVEAIRRCLGVVLGEP